LIVYAPTGTDGKAKRPASVVVCVCVTPVASFVAVTVAPGTTAPFASVTVPVMLEVLVWAATAAANNAPSSKQQSVRMVRAMASFLLTLVSWQTNG
jgi:hypothetical protein